MATFKFDYHPLSADYVVTDTYGSSSSLRSGLHGGIDLGVTGASSGTVPVTSVSSGTVTTAQWSNSYGNYVIVDHGNGYSTLYAHMSSLSVSVGDKISGGTQLGYMGSTGNSTGPHLHLEVLENGNRVNPTPYLNVGTLITSSTTTDPDYASNSYITSDLLNSLGLLNSTTSQYAATSAVGETVAGLTSQPIHAYVSICIGDKLLSTEPPKPNILQRFEVTRRKGVGDTASFVLFDDNWDEIEQYLSENWDNIVIEYGYSGSNITSGKYKMLLQNYSLSFNSTGVILTIAAMSLGQYLNMKRKSFSTESRNPTEAAKAICEAAGLTVIDSNFDETVSLSEDSPEFNMISDYPIAYILNTIVPSAITSDGEPITFYVDSNNVAYFKRESYVPNSSNGGTVKTYIFQKGYDSTVEDLTFDIKGVFGASSMYEIASNIQSVFIDTKTKEEKQYEGNTSSILTEATGIYQHTLSDQSNPLIDSSAYPYDQAKTRLFYKRYRSLTEAYEATMTIVGDPTLSLFDRVRIINVTDEGYLHHTSGIYMIKGIIDYVEDGKMTTSLRLVRNASINQGIELIHPRTLIN